MQPPSHAHITALPIDLTYPRPAVARISDAKDAQIRADALLKYMAKFTAKNRERARMCLDIWDAYNKAGHSLEGFLTRKALEHMLGRRNH